MDLSVRYVPTATKQFLNYMAIYPSRPQDHLENGVVNLLGKDPLPANVAYYQMLALKHPFPALNKQKQDEDVKGLVHTKFSSENESRLIAAYLEDLQHSDVPILACNLKGQVYYKGILIMDCAIKNSPLKAENNDEIRTSTNPTQSDSEHLFIVSLLEASIRHASALTWPPKGWPEVSDDESRPESFIPSSSNAPNS